MHIQYLTRVITLVDTWVHQWVCLEAQGSSTSNSIVPCANAHAQRDGACERKQWRRRLVQLVPARGANNAKSTCRSKRDARFVAEEPRTHTEISATRRCWNAGTPLRLNYRSRPIQSILYDSVVSIARNAVSVARTERRCNGQSRFLSRGLALHLALPARKRPPVFSYGWLSPGCCAYRLQTPLAKLPAQSF